jgi:hypothetical protein
MFHVKPLGQASVESGLLNCSPNHPRYFIEKSFTQGENLNVVQFERTNLLRSGLDLSLSASALHQHELASRANKRCSHGNELLESTDGTGGDLIKQDIAANVFGSVTHNCDVGETQVSNLVVEPSSPSLHGLNQYKIDVRTRNGENQAWETRTATHVTDTALEQGSNDAAVENVA